MMSKMTKKGQVTIPAAVRRMMGAETGDKIEFTALTDSTARLEVMRKTLRPISHERAEELLDERTRLSPEDANEKGSP